MLFFSLKPAETKYIITFRQDVIYCSEKQSYKIWKKRPVERRRQQNRQQVVDRTDDRTNRSYLLNHQYNIIIGVYVSVSLLGHHCSQK